MKKYPKYELLDSGNFQKLEQVGNYRLIRPALNAFWGRSLSGVEWENADASFNRNSSGNGSWSYKNRPLPESWIVDWQGFNLLIKPTSFGHLGFFAEQYRNWNFFKSKELNLDESSNALNLFAYSGVGSMAMAQTGASVCHLDASKGMIEWGRNNLEFNDIAGSIRWIIDDVIKFTNRELRRNNKYNLIALDPPSFGRGASGQLWKIENDLPKLLRVCRELSDPERDFTIVLSCHSPGFSILVLKRMLIEVFGHKAQYDGFEMTIPESTGRELPAGISVSCTIKK